MQAAAVARANRVEQRRDFDQTTRLRLIENDVDDIEVDLATFGDKLDRIQRLLTGILASTTAASILLAVNVIVIGGQ